METKRRLETDAVILKASIMTIDGKKEYLISVTENTMFGKVLEHYTEDNRWSGNSRYKEMVDKYIGEKPFTRTIYK